jgi:hypothetical protein
MANMCINFLTITGEDLTKIREQLKLASKSNQSWLPEGLEGRDNMRWMFDIYIVNDYEDLIEVQCETKWAQLDKELKAIGKIFNVNISNQYEELSSNLYGYSYFDIETMTTTDICLDEEDLGRVVDDEESGFYLLDGEFCENRDEAYDVMLQNKIEKFKTQQYSTTNGRN